MTSRTLLASTAAAVGLAACAGQPQVTAPPYKPVTTVLELMESVIAHAAEVYWESVQVTVDETGEHEQYPERTRNGNPCGPRGSRSPSPAIC